MNVQDKKLTLTQGERIALYTALNFYHNEAVQHLHRRQQELETCEVDFKKKAIKEEISSYKDTVNEYFQVMYDLGTHYDDDAQVDITPLLRAMRRLESYTHDSEVIQGWRMYLDILGTIAQEYLK